MAQDADYATKNAIWATPELNALSKEMLRKILAISKVRVRAEIATRQSITQREVLKITLNVALSIIEKPEG